MTAVRPGSLRARVVARGTDPGAPIWEASIPRPDPNADTFIGYYLGLPSAIAVSTRIIRDLLAERCEEIERKGDLVIDCPKCGDPARHEERVYPGGMSWRESCDSCGHEHEDSV